MRIFCEKIFNENYRKLNMYYNSILYYDPKAIKINSLQMIVSRPTFFVRLCRVPSCREKHVLLYPIIANFSCLFICSSLKAEV